MVVVELSLPLCIQCLWTNGVGTAECVFLGRDGRGFIVWNNSVAAWLGPAHRRQTQHSTLETATHTRNTQSHIPRGFSRPSGSRPRFSNSGRNNVTKDLKDTSSQTEQSVVIRVPHTLAPFVGGLLTFPSWVSRCCSRKSTPCFFFAIRFPKIKILEKYLCTWESRGLSSFERAFFFFFFSKWIHVRIVKSTEDSVCSLWHAS